MNSTIEEDPSQSGRTNIKAVFIGSYMVLFIMGIIGNGIVIVMICNVLSSMRKHSTIRQKRCHTSTSHVFVYVLGLSIVDLLVILHLPFLIFDLLKGQWIFGNAMCKLYWFGESVNKLLSSFLMCVLSWDRYLAVCRPVNSLSIRSTSVALFVLLCASLLATVLLLPVLVQATVILLDRSTMEVVQAGSERALSAEMADTIIAKCTFDTGDSVFVFYTFCMGFVMPALLISFFYSQVIYRLRKNTKNVLVSVRGHMKEGKSVASHRVQQVTKRIIMVIFFYFFCWTPQWTLTLMVQFDFLQVSWVTPFLNSLFFAAHLLVCFNSAANPVLYALINRELRAQHVAAMARKRQSITAATQVAIEFVTRYTNNERLRSSILSIDITSALPLTTRISRFLAGIKVNVFGGHILRKRISIPSRSPSKGSQISNEATKETVTPSLVLRINSNQVQLAASSHLRLDNDGSSIGQGEDSFL